MKNIKKIGIALAAACALALALPVLADEAGPKLNFEPQLTPKACNGAGEPIINIREKVKNDVDSGVAGNYWAFDNYEREIKVWAAGAGAFCAAVKYEGKFQAVAGQTAPAGTGTLSGRERGEFEGGYRAAITGSLLTSPLWKTRGSVGVVDYRCDLNANCPGYVSWAAQYFAAGYGFNYDWWGWIYHGGRFGAWINAVTGNSGNILDTGKSWEEKL